MLQINNSVITKTIRNQKITSYLYFSNNATAETHLIEQGNICKTVDEKP